MDKATAITSIRAKLVEGDIEAALQLLIDHLEPNRRQQRELSNRALQAKAQLEKTQRDEQQGIVSFENSKLSYNQITQQVLSIVDDWEHPEEAGGHATAARKISPQMIIVGVLMLAVIGTIGFRLFKKRSGGSTVVTAEGCPEFERDSRFNILVLPYHPVRGNDTPSPHKNLARRLDDFRQEIQEKIATSVRFRDEPVPELDGEAIQSGEECRARLVIWGGAEEVSSPPNAAIITTKYKYLLDGAEETFNFTKLALNDDIAVTGQNEESSIPTQGFFTDTITNYTSITLDGSLSEELENQIRLLFGIANMQSGNPQAALNLLEQAAVKDSSSTLLRDMAIAESHIQMKDTAGAVAAYDEALATHPNYWFALNNRALIYYKKGNYEEAIRNLDQKLKEDPNNVEALTIRGAVKTKTKQFIEAREDLQKAKELDEKKDKAHAPYIEKKFNVLEREVQAEKKRRDRAISRLSENANDITALSNLAESSRNLGDYQAANRAAGDLLKIEPDNVTGLAVRAEAVSVLTPRRVDTNVTRKIEQLAPEVKEELIMKRPVLRTIIGQR